MALSKITPCMFISEGPQLHHKANFPEDSVHLCVHIKENVTNRSEKN